MSTGQTLKYAAEIEPIADCPPSQAKPCQQTAFRWVHADLADVRNFQPKAIQGRANNPDSPSCCTDYALSFYETAEKAIRKFLNVERRYSLVRKTLGDHIAEVKIEPADGIAAPTNRRWGHFDFFEFAGASFAAPKSMILSVIPAHD